MCPTSGRLTGNRRFGADGIAPAVGVLVTVFLSMQLVDAPRVAVILAATAFGMLGLFEDLIGTPVRTRFCLQLACAVVALPWLLSGLEGTLLWQGALTGAVVLWILGYVNAFNFMDGIDGISVLQAVVAA